MTKPHPHAEFLHALADGREDEFEFHHESWHPSEWRTKTDFVWVICEYPDSWTVRRKPRTIRIGDMDVLPPMGEAPAIGTSYWLAGPTEKERRGIKWRDDSLDVCWLKAGMCHTTEEAAEQHRKALILVSGGTP